MVLKGQNQTNKQKKNNKTVPVMEWVDLRRVRGEYDKVMLYKTPKELSIKKFLSL